MLDVLGEVGGQVLLADLVEERRRGCSVVTTTGARISSPLSSDHAGRLAAVHKYSGDLGVEPDLGAEAEGGRSMASATAAHAALGEAPVAQVTVADVADRVVGHHVGGARLVWAGPGADDAVDGDGRL